jgi:orotate phosphoribosyltransferase
MAWERLRDLLVEHSYRYSDEANFTLSSGRRSSFYIDCKPTTMRHVAAPMIAELFEPHLPERVAAVGGLTMGADPIAYAVRDFSKRGLDVFVVRKEAKKHGLGQRIEGPVQPGMRVVVVDDVVTTGQSTITAVEACRGEGLIVAGVIVLVDREEDDGMQKIRQAVGPELPIVQIFTRSDLHDRWLQLKDHGNRDISRPRAAAG